jgi:hypothetical protein
MDELNAVEKAAVLLIALGPAKAQEILDRLGSSDLVAIISAMKRLQGVSEELKQSVLLEVNQLLMGLAANQFPASSDTKTPTRDDSDQVTIPPRGTAELDVEAPKIPEAQDVDLFGRIGPLLKDKIDPDQIDWGSAGFDFGEQGRWRRPPEEES